MATDIMLDDCVELHLFTAGSRARVWGSGGHRVSAEPEPIRAVWGQSPQWVQGQSCWSCTIRIIRISYGPNVEIL